MKRHNREEILEKLKQADAMLGRGYAASKVIQQLGVSEHTYYRWRKDFTKGQSSKPEKGGLKELERENQLLKQAVATLTLEKMGLDHAA